ncbi:4-hydroxy-tetrahydrodipicolinate synthase [Camelimonas fluminis]|uniref:4-hydroxy-tetrahydrodipicolinate synthase n=1 Tax=Camelimonas fluminis TaxID=1576911 RepID=A0ABV7UNS2_9HYPH|nr:4-hydroxy-tetrahydrodipicolinate synthase [Camelimonas fluminis]GHE78534.1 4-hydroxy-tetrahydrodipicolinate synthase [Camelimonas fluminis]
MKRKSEPPIFGGLITALVTPFRGDQIDFEALAELVDWQIGQGVQGLVACGTTAESPTLSASEWADVIRLCVDVSRGRAPVIAGSGTNDTRRTIEMTREAARLGADGALVVTPYYNRPGQEGLFRHFDCVSRSTELPIILYNVPARTGLDISVDTLERLAESPGIVGIKDATGDLAKARETVSRLGDRFTLLSGHDRSTPEFMAVGGDGAISVISNLTPRLCAAMIFALQQNEPVEARRIQALLLPLQKALELETNPGPVKYALHCTRGYAPSVRLPLVEVTDDTALRIREAIATLTMPTVRLSMGDATSVCWRSA